MSLSATVLPPRDSHALDDLHLPHEPSEAAYLISPDGQRVALPAQVYEALALVVRAMAEGQAVTIVPQNRTIGTKEAADLLGISRPTLVKLLNEGKIPYTTPGRSHHRLKLEDVLAYRRSRAADRVSALADMVAQTESLGLYEHQR
jgi:excisionase family DNA binding protein